MGQDSPHLGPGGSAAEVLTGAVRWRRPPSRATCSQPGQPAGRAREVSARPGLLPRAGLAARQAYRVARATGPPRGLAARRERIAPPERGRSWSLRVKWPSAAPTGERAVRVQRAHRWASVLGTSDFASPLRRHGFGSPFRPRPGPNRRSPYGGSPAGTSPPSTASLLLTDSASGRRSWLTCYWSRRSTATRRSMKRAGCSCGSRGRRSPRLRRFGRRSGGVAFPEHHRPNQMPRLTRPACRLFKIRSSPSGRGR
jgi:hypothetical protein